MKNIAVFPGSFDPFTIGHEEIVTRGLGLFERVIVAVGENAGKQEFLDITVRVELIRQVFRDEPRVSVERYAGMTVDYCERAGASFLLRGLRTAADFEYERAVGQINRAMNPRVETVFLLTSPQRTFISSSIVKDILLNGGDASSFLPSHVTREEIMTSIKRGSRSPGGSGRKI
ncbi:MAG: pantetheine-phosphate adenylyltransferase [Odoribacteraceae bacterium]|jgi:pantetheine-phosphate adenylyltransferase|nr:pantetheine-phosphate adenylyltransferase [Odoribacteraceae bacterium]